MPYEFWDVGGKVRLLKQIGDYENTIGMFLNEHESGTSILALCDNKVSRGVISPLR